MRKRNVELKNSIGDLIEEIAKQDLELVNGGTEEVNQDNMAQFTPIVINTENLKNITKATYCCGQPVTQVSCGGLVEK